MNYLARKLRYTINQVVEEHPSHMLAHGVYQPANLDDSRFTFRRYQNSGCGRELSSMGIQEFVNKKLVRVASIDWPIT